MKRLVSLSLVALLLCAVAATGCNKKRLDTLCRRMAS